MGQQPQPPIVLFLLSAAATARAAMEQWQNSRNPRRRPRRLIRQLTSEELGPLVEPVSSFVLEASTLAETAIAIALESANEAAAPLISAMSACFGVSLNIFEVGTAGTAGAHQEAGFHLGRLDLDRCPLPDVGRMGNPDPLTLSCPLAMQLCCSPSPPSAHGLPHCSCSRPSCARLQCSSTSRDL